MGRMNRSRNADLPMRRHTANHPPSPPNSLAEKTFRRRQTLCHITGVAAHSRTVRRRVVIGNSNTLLEAAPGPTGITSFILGICPGHGRPCDGYTWGYTRADLAKERGNQSQNS